MVYWLCMFHFRTANIVKGAVVLVQVQVIILLEIVTDINIRIAIEINIGHTNAQKP